MVEKSFKKCCITNDLDGLEDDHLWEGTDDEDEDYDSGAASGSVSDTNDSYNSDSDGNESDENGSDENEGDSDEWKLWSENNMQ